MNNSREYCPRALTPARHRARSGVTLVTALLALSFVTGCSDKTSSSTDVADDTTDDIAELEDGGETSDAVDACSNNENLEFVEGTMMSPPNEDGAIRVKSSVPYTLSVVSVGNASPLPASLTSEGQSGQPDEWTLEAPNAPGRYTLTLTADPPCTAETTARYLFIAPPAEQPDTSSTLARGPVIGGKERFAVVETDDNSLTIFEADNGSLELIERAETCTEPQRVAWNSDTIAVTCPSSNIIQTHDANAANQTNTIELVYAASPFAIVADNRTEDGFIAASRFREELYIVRNDELTDTVTHGLNDVRGLLQIDDNQVALSRWRSPREAGIIRFFDLSTRDSTDTALPFDPLGASDTETGGVPTYLDTMTLTPDGSRLLIPGLQANVAQGEFLNGRPFTQDEVLRAKLSTLDMTGEGTPTEEDRILFDDRGLASAAVTSPAGDYAFIAMRGSRTVERLDLLRNDVASGSLLNVGLAPTSMLMTRDAHMLVHSTLSREVSSWDISDWGPSLQPTTRLATVDEEPLDEQVHRGKVLFNDSYDLRITADGYLACAHCHFDGESDHRIWDFTDRGEGLRRTISLRGRAGTAHGPLHWTANFDEIQDFENDIRLHFGGLGLLSEDDWTDPSIRNPLGDPKAGLSEDLDALTAYVETFTSYPQSPHRTRNGEWTDAALEGADIFRSEQTGCTNCHSDNNLTDSQFIDGNALLHNVGTLTEGSGERQGQPLTGLDTPTLHATFNNISFLHHGNAPTLRDVLTTFNENDEHGTTSNLTNSELNALTKFLLSLDGELPANGDE